MATATAAAAGAIVVGSVWGTLARLGLVGLTSYDGQSITPLVWAQAVGCLVMGWASHARTQRALEAWHPTCIVLLTTGFAGSCTSFSSWVLQVFQAFANDEHWDRRGLHSVMDALTQTGATVGLGLAGLWAGHAVADSFPMDQVRMHTVPPRLGAWALVMAGVLTWAGAALLCGLYTSYRDVTLAVVMAPAGALMRWQLARLNVPRNAKEPRPLCERCAWPWGTALANLLATLLFAALVTLQRTRAHTQLTCHALDGLQNGFAGTLSTVSTLMLELTMLRPLRTAFAYLFVSWVVGVLVCLWLVGVPTWTMHLPSTCAIVP
ncbi:hypothetical protein MEQU1_003213 [Malassezia equina]|uniref:Uncharacterized protein n=1 Tax=Malassezia equina TaxID=1381935 RepID=A0AAF0EKQ0_9BASI|nr:hypothetical protein MEQU1_003213 [Malassezia equina]